MRHHYSVTGSGPGQGEARRFHSFEDANGHFDEVYGRAKEAGARLEAESYWRRILESPDGRVKLALDDVGLAPCDDTCGGG